MAYQDFLKHINDNVGYYKAYRAVSVKCIKQFTPGIMKHVKGEDGASLKIEGNNYSFILKMYRIFIN